MFQLLHQRFQSLRLLNCTVSKCDIFVDKMYPSPAVECLYAVEGKLKDSKEFNVFRTCRQRNQVENKHQTMIQFIGNERIHPDFLTCSYQVKNGNIESGISAIDQVYIGMNRHTQAIYQVSLSAGENACSMLIVL